MTRIAVLDNDVDMLETVCGLLQHAGYHTVRFRSGREMIRALHRDGYDLFVLDWNVPDFSGVYAIEWVRDQLGTRLPVLLLTDRAAEEDVVAGLRAGADDFVTKPFQPAVLLARIEALLRRSSGGSADAIEQYGPYEYNLVSRTATLGREELVLTPKEFNLSLLLFRHLDRAVARGYIMETVWGMDPDISTRTLDIHISRLRAKLKLNAANGYRLSTIYGHGYRLEEAAP